MRKLKVLTIMVVLLASFLFAVYSVPVVHAAGTLLLQASGDFCCDLGTPGSVLLGSVTRGDVIIVAVGQGLTPTNLISSISDSLSQTFMQPAGFPECGSAGCATIYYATLSIGGAETITVTLSTSIFDFAIYAYELSGITTIGASAVEGYLTSSSDLVSIPIATSPASFTSLGFLIGTVVSPCECTPSLIPGTNFNLSPYPTSSTGWTGAEWSTAGVSSPTTFPGTLSESFSGWVEVGVAFETSIPPIPPPIPEYPLGLPILAILTVIAYGLIKRRTRIPDNHLTINFPFQPSFVSASLLVG